MTDLINSYAIGNKRRKDRRIVLVRVLKLILRKVVYLLLLTMLLAVTLVLVLDHKGDGSYVSSYFKQFVLRLSSFGNDNNKLLLRHVFVSGINYSDAKNIVTQVDPRLGEPILLLDLDSIKRRLEATSWVEKASVIRQFPNTLYIHITERVPAMLLQSGGDVSLIDRNANVIESDIRDEFLNLIIVSGDIDRHDIYQLISILKLDKNVARLIDTVHLANDYHWHFGLKNGQTIKLLKNRVIETWKTFVHYNDQYNILDSDEVSYIDLRLPNKIVVR